MPQATFVLKEPSSQNSTLVYLIYRFNNNRLKYSTGQKINPRFWNPEKQRAKETKQFPEYGDFNGLLNRLEHRVNDDYRKLINDKIVPTPEKLALGLNEVLLKGEATVKHDVLSFAKHLIDTSTKKPETIANYKQTLKNLEEFKRLKSKPLPFELINLDFYDEFMMFC